MTTNELYFKFLIRKVKVHTKPLIAVCRQLYNTEFIYDDDIWSDKNRIGDGEELRYEFAVFAGDGINNVASDDAMGEILEMPCTVLEVLVALAVRIDSDITGEPGEDRAEEWFNQMIANLGLDVPRTESEVSYILNRWLTRRYDENGSGGLFPLITPYRDQRTIGLWEQASDYISDKRNHGGII